MASRIQGARNSDLLDQSHSWNGSVLLPARARWRRVWSGVVGPVAQARVWHRALSQPHSANAIDSRRRYNHSAAGRTSAMSKRSLGLAVILITMAVFQCTLALRH